MKVVRVKVSSRTAKKLMSVRPALAKTGVQVDRRPVKYRTAHDLIGLLRDAWLVYSIGKEAWDRWPEIRKLLVRAGLTRYEITTLGLSQYTRTAAKKKSAQKKKSLPRKKK